MSWMPFNLFVLLDLDPNDEWDQERFEQRLKEKQREWSKLVPHPKKSWAAKANLEKLPQLKKIAADEAERVRHATEARRLRSVEQEQLELDLHEEMELLQAKGHLLKAEFEDLVTRYAGVFSESDIRARLSVPVIEAVEPPETPKEKLDPAKVNEINRALADLGKELGRKIEDLYDFLELSPKTEPGILKEKAHKFYIEVQHRGVKNAKVTLESNLAGLCMEMFASQASKEKFDATLDESKYADLRKNIDLILAHSNVVHPAQIELLMQRARERGLDPNKTWELILVNVANRGPLCLPYLVDRKAVASLPSARSYRTEKFLEASEATDTQEESRPPIVTDRKKNVYGINFGLTNCSIAVVGRDGDPTVIRNFEGDRTTPSVVYFDDNRRVVGSEAKNLALVYPDSAVEMVKREMGNAEWRFHYQGVDYSPEKISSYILRKVVSDAEKFVGDKITDVVITCPAYFRIIECEAMAKAGEIAGLNVVSIINEPKAAVTAYGVQQDQDQVVLVYDLGGGSFDITMIAIRGGKIEIIVTGGNHHLGGRNWDEVVVNYLADQWLEKTNSSDNPLDDPETLQDLWDKAEKAKKVLSAPGKDKTEVSVLSGGTHEKITLTREKFDELTGNLLAQTIQLTRMMLQTAKEKGYAKFDRMLLVGGSTRMPQVKERLHREFGIQPELDNNPDEITAKGAAIYGHWLQEAHLGTCPACEAKMRGILSPNISQDQLNKVAKEVADYFQLKQLK